MIVPPQSACRRALLLAGAAWMSGCAVRPSMVADAPGGWHDVPLPGKAPTRYRTVRKDGRLAVAAHADGSASMWRRRVDVPSDRLGDVAFSWRVDELIDGASVAHAEREDASARILFGFGGEVSRLPARTRMMFELAQALTGEAPPFATLMYVWERSAPEGSVIVNPRTDRVRKLVLDSGAAQLGRWREHRRSLVRDFRLAFGENPGPLRSIALMTDADNTRSVARAWYGPVQLL